MRDTGGDWTRRHARLGPSGRYDDGEHGAGSRTDTDDDRTPLVRAEEPPTDDWRARHAWCQRQ